MTSSKRPTGWNFSSRRGFLLVGLIASSGCSSFLRRRDTEDTSAPPLPYSDKEGVEYVGDISDPWGLNPSKVESIALATELDGTGSDPDPSSRRTRLLNEMKVRQVANEKELLASPNTALVLVQGYMPPGIRKGDRYDVFVQTPSRSKTTSLRGGYLMPTRLQPMEVLGQGIRTGSVQSTAKGPIIVDELFSGDEPGSAVRGAVLGGGVAMITRPFGLAVHSDVASIAASTTIAGAINRRFSTVHQGEKRGVAEPKDDSVIELLLPREYQFHLGRYIEVIMNIAVDETPEMRRERVENLARELNDPFLASRAAMRLEAVGDEAVPILLRAITSGNPEIRFYAAESLAYMGEQKAAPVLGEIAQREPTLRWHAMTALASMTGIESGVELTNLLHAEEQETRYAAFHALRARSPQDPVIRGELMRGEFYYHVVSSNASPMIHFSRAKRPEIVLFGKDQRFGDNFLYVKRGMTIKGLGNGQVTVSQYRKQGNNTIECSSRVDDLMRVMIDGGAGYEELYELVRHAENMGALNSQLAVNAVPDPNRYYDEQQAQAMEAVGTGSRSGVFKGILPDLFADPAKQVRDDEEEISDFDQSEIDESPNKKSFFGRMGSWWKKDA